MISQQIGMWGNNLAVRIPQELNVFKKGDRVTVTPTKEGILISPAKRRRRTIEEILANEKGVFKGDLVDFGSAVGEEFEL